MAARVGSANLPHPLPQPLEGQQRVKSAPRHGEHGRSSRRDRLLRGSAPARSRRCATGAQRASGRHPPPPRRPHPCLRIPSRPLSLSQPRPAPRPGGEVCGARGGRKGSPPRKRGGGGPLRCLRPGPQGHPCLGQTLGYPPGRREKFFFPPGAPPPRPALRPTGVGLGPLGKKVAGSHQLLLPLGTRCVGRCLEAAPSPAQKRCVLGLQRSRCRPKAAPISECLRAWQRQHPTCFISSCSATASEQASEKGERGSLSAKCCSLVLRGGCSSSSSNSHSFCRLT